VSPFGGVHVVPAGLGQRGTICPRRTTTAPPTPSRR